MHREAMHVHGQRVSLIVRHDRLDIVVVAQSVSSACMPAPSRCDVSDYHHVYTLNGLQYWP